MVSPGEFPSDDRFFGSIFPYSLVNQKAILDYQEMPHPIE